MRIRNSDSYTGIKMKFLTRWTKKSKAHKNLLTGHTQSQRGTREHASVPYTFTWDSALNNKSCRNRNSDAPYQTRPWSFLALCTCPCPLCCTPGLPIPVLTGELLKTAIGYAVLLPNYQPRTCTCYLSRKLYTIIQKCFRCIVPLLTCSCLMSYVLAVLRIHDILVWIRIRIRIH